MHAIRTRLAKLEKQAGIAASPGQFIVVKSFSQDDDIDGLLASQGIDPEDPRHQVVILQSFSQHQPAHVLYAMPR